MNENVEILHEIIAKEEKMLDILLNAIEGEPENDETRPRESD
jgi:hypothetical protein